jgi:hypothetical protein
MLGENPEQWRLVELHELRADQHASDQLLSSSDTDCAACSLQIHAAATS